MKTGRTREHKSPPKCLLYDSIAV